MVSWPGTGTYRHVRGIQRPPAWIANLHAALGDTRSALRTTNELAQTHPTNGYIHYRLCHVLAEIGYLDDAVKMLGSAVDHGFLSTQLLRQEELLALQKLNCQDSHSDRCGVSQ